MCWAGGWGLLQRMQALCTTGMQENPYVSPLATRRSSTVPDFRWTEMLAEAAES
jgi:hypothetical protein